MTQVDTPDGQSATGSTWNGLIELDPELVARLLATVRRQRQALAETKKAEKQS